MDARSVALAYLQAVGEKRFDDVRALLHEDLEFTAGSRTLDKAETLAALRRLGLILDRNEFRKTFVDGDEVCVIYDFVTDTPVGPVPSVEWIRIEDGKVRSVLLVFERERWPEVLEVLAQRAGA
jgi:hypothetical protein